MVKPLLLLAFMANVFCLTLSSEPNSKSSAVAHASSSSGSSTSFASVSSSSSSFSSHKQSKHIIIEDDDCDCGPNERQVSCPEAVCVPKTCDDVGFPFPCYDLAPNGVCPSPPGCICIEGFVKNKNGKCIPMSKCSSCGGDFNAKSGCGVNCNRRCNKGNNNTCIEICYYNACDCKEGYLLDEVTNKCVKPSQCPPPKQCKKNEVYDLCPAPCPLRTCGINDAAVDCVPSLNVGDPNCAPPKCRCKDGFYKNNVGDCVRYENCPKCLNPNEEYDPCIAPCPPRRCDVDDTTILCLPSPVVGDPSCVAGCRCSDGFYKNAQNVCVPRDQCPPPKQCKKNEVYDLCPAPCPLRTCGINDAAVDCVPSLNVGDPNCAPPKCRCKDGFYKNNVGDCVRYENCPKCLNPNEEYDPCIAPCPPRRCDVDDTTILCLPSPVVGDPSCVAGCRCSDGFYKNAQNVCVPRDQCQVCPQNEVYDLCIAPCPPRRCDVDDRVIRCAAPPKLGDPSCVSGCRCADGYYRNANGTCVIRDNCPLPCKSDETYERCPPFLCQPLACTDVGFPINYPTQEYGCPGNAACICADNKVRDDQGKCVQRNQCPSCGGDSNAVAGCGVNCNKRCRDIGTESKLCIAICYENACDCKKGFFLDENTGKCVLPEQCTPQCGPNEQYNECINGGCKAQNCSQIGFPIPCRKIDPKNCKKGCLCKDGYARNEAGFCIPENECSTCGGDKNAQPGCGTNCNRLCSDIGKEPGFCIALCKENACDCKKGYYFDINKQICVKPQDCTPTCGTNERYSECTIADCNPQNCTQLGFPIACPSVDSKSCKSGCLCNVGYLRNDTGVCVPSKECRACRGDVNAQSGCGGYCNRRCSDIGKEPRVCTLICELNGCDCKEDYYLDDKTNKCVKPENCSLTCGKNEEYNECTNANCAPQNCTQLGYSIPCPRIDPKFCKKGCQCKSGYARDGNGICIPVRKCLSCRGDENAQSGCGGYCNRRCSDIGKEPRACTKICEINACDCKDGFYLNDNTKKCVKPENCQPTCGKNEEYNECTNANCNPQNCSQVGYPVNCPIVAEGSCKKGCQCKPGYVRSNKDICISVNECPSCGGDPNAVSGCGGFCDKRCSDVGEDPRPCILICQLNGCDCKEGYYRDDNTNKCVKLEDCTPTCGTNEEYNECTNSNCAPQNCTQLGFSVPCPRIDPKYCKKGCQCKSGYFRNNTGACIPASECPSCGGDPNATAGCGVNCNRHCSDIGKEPGACLAICNLNGCDCKEGYYLDSSNQCVKPEDCNRPKCLAKNNEVYSGCINGGCTRRNCSQYGKPVPCIKLDPKYCIKGCICKEGYLRASNGQCIPQKNCPEACNGPHEIYNNCTYDCPPQVCESLDKVYACPIKTGDNCKPLCKCEPGYFRNKNGECITEEQCRKCLKPHEFYSCGGACDNICATIKEQNQTNCPIINIKCNEMCYCEKDYARARNNTCIPISKCNEPQCPINERYEKCPGASCQPLTCSQLGAPILCPAQENYTHCPYKPGCVCIDGYVRREDGKCVPVNECPACGGDPNARSGCGVNCGKYCRDLLIDDDIACIDICYFNSCDCKDGYYYDIKQKICVLPGECTDVCGKNEVYEDCSDPICRAKNCTDLGFPQDCDKCRKGCVCEDGYARNGTGTCIPVRECPSCGGDPNAVSGCGVNCGKLCPNNNRNPNVCPRICYPNACDCRDGYSFDNNTKTCVKPEECSPRCDELNNEVYDGCTNGGCEKKNCSQLGRPDICIHPLKCNQGCSCKEGYLRRDDGICVPVDQCPTGCGGDPNAQPGCGFNCGKKCPRETSKKFCPRIACKPDKCDCKDGFVLDSNIGKCVKPQDCSPICDASNNEVYDSCINGGCNKRNCSQLGSPLICIDPIECKQGCSCKGGYLRLNNGTCVPVKQCPRPKCMKNERFEQCPPRVCQPQTCSVVGYDIECPVIDDDQCGYPACICNNNYARNFEGVCIPINQCPGCGGDPNAVSGCGINCNKRCPKKTNGPCPRIACKRNGCECKDGFLFDGNFNKCVKQNKCSPICDSSNNEVYDACINGGCNKRNCSQLASPDICIDPLKCIQGCSCKEGYLRLNNDTCVSADQCPEPQCKNNERFEKCPGKVCEPQFCNVVGYPLNCSDSDECGLPACICQSGYARDADGDCVPTDECPTCGGDPNAKPGCGFHCVDRCPKGVKPEFCPRIQCSPKSCDCKEGFFYDENIKRCVKSEECSPVCDTLNNEVYDPCVNGYCGWKNCSQVGGPQICVDVSSCVKGCSCKKDYYRLDNGTCVPEDQCPQNCPRPNEIYDSCASNCTPQTCRSIGKKFHCPLRPAVCKGECRCKPKYYRNAINECISEKDCLKCTGQYEYFSCGPYCDNECSKLDEQSKDNCPVKTFVCVPRCYCEDGYARNESGICIPIPQCPKRPTTTSTTTTVKPKTPPPSVNVTTALANFQQANQDLAIQFLYQKLQDSPGESFVFSTESLLLALVQLIIQAVGTNLAQLLKLIKLENKEQIKSIFPIMIQSLNEQRDVIFKLANKLYVTEIYPLAPQYIEETKKTFGSVAENIDFNDSKKAADIINQWASNNTNGLINGIVNPDMFNANTRLVVVNAIYFLGNWIKQFNKDNTKDRDFYITETTTKPVPTMYQKGSFRYAENGDLNCKLLELPYKGGNFSFVIVLPNEKAGLPDVVKTILLDSTKLSKAIESMRTETVEIYLPKMDLATNLDIKPMLQKLGVTAAFDSSSDGFTGILAKPEPLYISDIVQKAVIKVSENGTEAAAVTVISVGVTSVQLPREVKNFDVNHPAAFFLMFKRSIIFNGVFAG